MNVFTVQTRRCQRKKKSLKNGKLTADKVVILLLVFFTSAVYFSETSNTCPCIQSGSIVVFSETDRVKHAHSMSHRTRTPVIDILLLSLHLL